MTTIEKKYLARIAKTKPTSARLAFRGHADSSWKLHSGATRRLLQEIRAKGSPDDQRSSTFAKLYVSYHRSVLLAAARNSGLDATTGLRDSDLQLLSKLQHLGAATGLLDFTWDSLVALWFATAAPQGRQCPGRVIVVNLNDSTNFQRLAALPEHQTLESAFPLAPGNAGRQYYWEPRYQDEASNRVLRQRSVFLIGRPLGPEVSKDGIVAQLTIQKEDKEIIRKELESLFGVSEQSLFPDIHGFARANSQSAPISHLDDPEFFETRGIELYQSGEYLAAIHSYGDCIRLDPGRWMAYYLRGNAWAQVNERVKAVDDYTDALELLRMEAKKTVGPRRAYHDHHILMAAFNRGNMRYSLGEYDDACKDYGEAIRLAADGQHAMLWYNRANARARMGDFAAALEDYDHAIRGNVGHARFNKGNALLKMGRLEDALECFLKTSKTLDSEQLKNNIAIVREVLKRIGASTKSVSTFEQESGSFAGMDLVTLHVNQVELSKLSPDPATMTKRLGAGRTYLCSGSAGNVGNFGGGGTDGGRGLSGENGFGLRIAYREAEQSQI
ncbi:MAG: tetratricopeptide repeat protein [Boseongicola sp. SB0664_bin_43]|uniref:Tetratricopeptide repeat protein n=1 Tax=Boseongicola sp. SB0664_bin_43 TaxID=2604844 RepID=A0A6B0Y1S0_9RHOB|nr:tetratricopeptide repeat protein [Boseongicola sp. SB0664_bin_43]